MMCVRCQWWNKTTKGTWVSALKWFYCGYELFKQDSFTTGVIKKTHCYWQLTSLYIIYLIYIVHSLISCNCNFIFSQLRQYILHCDFFLIIASSYLIFDSQLQLLSWEQFCIKLNWSHLQLYMTLSQNIVNLSFISHNCNLTCSSFWLYISQSDFIFTIVTESQF